ncbi:MAG: BT_3928 family protein [Chitinophagales bacterium]
MNKFLRIICVLIGALFIVSGFVKAVDPVGFSIKLDEYFEVFAEDTSKIGFISSFFLWLRNISVYLSMFFCVLEMVLGFMLLIGFQMELTSWLMLLLIVFFTWLTGYSAITNTVTDCGCFGDALHLTPWQSFNKDVVLLVFILLIFAFRHRIKPLFSKNIMGTVLVVAFAALCSYMTIYCYQHLPIIDFRAYKVGNDIREQMTLPEGKTADQYVTILTYKDKRTGETGDYVMTNNNEEQSAWFSAKNLKSLPWQDSLWMDSHEFVQSNSEIVVKGEKPKITDFKVWDNDNQDATSLVLDEPNYHFWLIAQDMTKTNKDAFDKVNQLASECEKNKIQFMGLTSTPYELLDPIRHDLNAPFPFYYADGTVLKTIIRSNPGLVLLKGSKVLGQWHYNDIPTYDEVAEKYFEN